MNAQARDNSHTAASGKELAQVAQIFKAAIEIEPTNGPALVQHFVRERNFDLLQALLDARVIGPDFEGASDIVCALGPLVGPGEYERERADLVAGWLKLLDLDTPQKLGALLHEVSLPEVMSFLECFGADPLAIVPPKPGSGLDNCTALGCAVFTERSLAALEMLSALIKEGRHPVAYQTTDETKSLFDAIAAGDLHHPDNQGRRKSSVTILSALAEKDPPASWQHEAGQALLRFLEEKGQIAAHKDHAMLTMMGVARFDNPADWLSLMRGGQVATSIPGKLLEEQNEQLALRIIANMDRDGVDMNAISSEFMKDGARTAPWLHAAVALDRSAIVAALLEAGCDTGPASHVCHGEVLERDALVFADPSSTSARLVLSWRAKETVSDVLKNAAAASREQP